MAPSRRRVPPRLTTRTVSKDETHSTAPAPGNGATPPGCTTQPCPLCQEYMSVELTVEKNKLTLKHNRENNLEIKVTGSNYTVDEYRIEIKRASGGQWCCSTGRKTSDTWKAVHAGKFKLRGVVKACGPAST